MNNKHDILTELDEESRIRIRTLSDIAILQLFNKVADGDGPRGETTTDLLKDVRRVICDIIFDDLNAYKFDLVTALQVLHFSSVYLCDHTVYPKDKGDENQSLETKIKNTNGVK